MRRRWRLWLALTSLLVLTGVGSLPSVYWPVCGWLSGEAFYKGMPTSYWSNKARGMELWNPSGWIMDWHVVPRRASWERPVEQLTGWYWPHQFEVTDGDPAALPVLAQMLHDPDPEVRCIALHGFKMVADVHRLPPAMLVALHEAEHDPDPKVRDWADAALLIAEHIGARN